MPAMLINCRLKITDWQPRKTQVYTSAQQLKIRADALIFFCFDGGSNVATLPAPPPSATITSGQSLAGP